MKRFSSHLFASKREVKGPTLPTFCPKYPYFTLLFALNIPILPYFLPLIHVSLFYPTFCP